MKAPAIVVLLLFTGATVWAAREMHVYGIVNFGGQRESQDLYFRPCGWRG
jgi:hypothetical protein